MQDKAPNTGLALPIATKILALEKLEFWFFAKMAAKTTSGSGFDFIFRFSMVDLVEIDTKLEIAPPYTFSRKLTPKLKNSKKI